MPNTSRLGTALLLSSQPQTGLKTGCLHLLPFPLPQHRLLHSIAHYCPRHRHRRQLLLGVVLAVDVRMSTPPLPLLHSFRCPLSSSRHQRNRGSMCCTDLIAWADCRLLTCLVFTGVSERETFANDRAASSDTIPPAGFFKARGRVNRHKLYPSRTSYFRPPTKKVRAPKPRRSLS